MNGILHQPKWYLKCTYGLGSKMYLLSSKIFSWWVNECINENRHIAQVHKGLKYYHQSMTCKPETKEISNNAGLIGKEIYLRCIIQLLSLSWSAMSIIIHRWPRILNAWFFIFNVWDANGRKNAGWKIHLKRLEKWKTYHHLARKKKEYPKKQYHVYHREKKKKNGNSVYLS